MKKAACVIMVLSVAGLALADSINSEYAYETGTIQPGGPRQPTAGDRYFNIEGASNGQYASYGVARWDLAGIKAAFDGEFGIGNWKIDGVTLALTQENSGFTTNGPVKLFFSAHDTVDAKTPASPLAYPDTAPLGVDVNNDPTILEYDFVEVATGHVDTYTLDAPVINSEILVGDVLTLVFFEGGPDVAATYRGQEGYQDRMPPEILVEASFIPEPAGLLLLSLGFLFRRR